MYGNLCICIYIYIDRWMDTLHEQPHGHGFGHMFLENDEMVGIMDIPWIFLYIYIYSESFSAKYGVAILAGDFST